MNCPRCQRDNPIADAQVCPRCGAPANYPEDGAAPLIAYADLQRELTEARDQQTGMSEILRVISSAPNDVQPVFEAIAESAARLCRAQGLIVFQVHSEMIGPVAAAGASPEALAFYLARSSAGGR